MVFTDILGLPQNYVGNNDLQSFKHFFLVLYPQIELIAEEVYLQVLGSATQKTELQFCEK